jgi:hypothetical protein
VFAVELLRNRFFLLLLWTACHPSWRHRNKKWQPPPPLADALDWMGAPPLELAWINALLPMSFL